MERFYLVVSFCLILMISCESSKNEQKNNTIDIEGLSVEDKYAIYVDSVNIFNPKTQNIPKFITEYYEEFDNNFKYIYNIHKPTPDSRKESVYSDLFFKCNLKQLRLIKTELENKKKITKQDLLIISTIEYVLSKNME